MGCKLRKDLDVIEVEACASQNAGNTVLIEALRVEGYVLPT
jgi:hypothetical protein